MYRWHDVPGRGQNPSLHVIKQLTAEDFIVAQIWRHIDEDGTVSYSMNMYADPQDHKSREVTGTLSELLALGDTRGTG
ncbi:hypothetical protein J2T17_007477 [Paenibacillus mucilaginosus]